MTPEQREAQRDRGQRTVLVVLVFLILVCLMFGPGAVFALVLAGGMIWGTILAVMLAATVLMAALLAVAFVGKRSYRGLDWWARKSPRSLQVVVVLVGSVGVSVLVISFLELGVRTVEDLRRKGLAVRCAHSPARGRPPTAPDGQGQAVYHAVCPSGGGRGARRRGSLPHR